MIQLDEDERYDRITIVADFPKLDPGSAFSYWIDPARLKKWWPPVAELDPRKGGRYHFSWPKQDWHLRGVFTEFQSGRRLVFTWKWDHESVDLTQVSLVFEPLTTGGTSLRLVHSGYTNYAAGRKVRNEHVRDGSSSYQSYKSSHNPPPLVLPGERPPIIPTVGRSSST